MHRLVKQYHCRQKRDSHNDAPSPQLGYEFDQPDIRKRIERMSYILKERLNHKLT